MQVELMPEHTGLAAEEISAFINRWRQVAPDLRILEISPDPLIWNPNLRPQDVGAPDRYLDIPFTLEQLGEAVQQCLEACVGDGAGDTNQP